jgi:hypothetical protein
MRGVNGDSFFYVIRDSAPPNHFDTEEHWHLYQIPHFGPSYDTDCKTMYYQLKEYLLHMVGYAWIQKTVITARMHVRLTYSESTTT